MRKAFKDMNRFERWWWVHGSDIKDLGWMLVIWSIVIVFVTALAAFTWHTVIGLLT
jgi:hypothetical protein